LSQTLGDLTQGAGGKKQYCNLKYQQNLDYRKIAIVVLFSTSWPRIQRKTEEIQRVFDGLVSGDYVEIEV
jgi:hypothetical protein